MLVVTHDANVAAHCRREIFLRDGKVADPADPAEGAPPPAVEPQTLWAASK